MFFFLAPTGDTIPAKISQFGNEFKVDYVSKQVGRHVIEVTYAGRPINGSPFYVDVYDPSKVTVDNLRDCEVNSEASFDGKYF